VVKLGGKAYMAGLFESPTVDVKPATKFVVVWDSGASFSISFCNKDFVGEIKPPGFMMRLRCLVKGRNILGVGEVLWILVDTVGKP